MSVKGEPLLTGARWVFMMQARSCDLLKRVRGPEGGSDGLLSSFLLKAYGASPWTMAPKTMSELEPDVRHAAPTTY